MQKPKSEPRVWTKAEIKAGLEKYDVWVERALLALYSLQSPEERKQRKNLVDDGSGFDNADVSMLTSFVVFFQKYRAFTKYQIEIARIRLMKYAGQLCKLANMKEAIRFNSKRPRLWRQKRLPNL